MKSTARMRANVLHDFRRQRGNADNIRLSDAAIFVEIAIAIARASGASDRKSRREAAQKRAIKHVKIFCAKGRQERSQEANLTRIERIGLK
jgi:hypothetical protein